MHCTFSKNHPIPSKRTQLTRINIGKDPSFMVPTTKEHLISTEHLLILLKRWNEGRNCRNIPPKETKERKEKRMNERLLGGSITWWRSWIRSFQRTFRPQNHLGWWSEPLWSKEPGDSRWFEALNPSILGEGREFSQEIGCDLHAKAFSELPRRRRNRKQRSAWPFLSFLYLPL